MEPAFDIRIIEPIVAGLEFFGVAIIAFCFLHAVLRALVHWGQKKPDAYERLKSYLGKALQLGLEFLVAADIISTVTTPTMNGLLLLALLIVLRTFLSWSITVESEGCWPWQVGRDKKGKSHGSFLAKAG